jgi:hypothetical protein
MVKMEEIMKINILIVAIACLLSGAAQGAHLASLDGGGLWGQVDRYIDDSDTTIPSSSMSDAGGTSCDADINGFTAYSFAQGSMSGSVGTASYWGAGLGTAVTLNASADCFSDDIYSVLSSYGNTATLVPAYTDGIFFVIEPDTGENTGDFVRVQWHWSAGCTNFTGNAQSSVAGGGTIYLSRNVIPPTGLPETGIMWSREGVTFAEPGSEEATGSFLAQIGDVIGVFFSASANADLMGAGVSGADVTTSMEILAGALPKLVEYPYAPGLVYDPCQNITFLKDWSAAGGPVNWDDANAWAENFTFISNSITYSNWRMPRTIEAGPWSTVGELGFLNANYGISEEYFGPFTNLSAGDYWTGPQFSRDPDPNIVYTFTFSTTYGPSQWEATLSYDNGYIVPVFDGPPLEKWCPADFDNDGVVDFKDFVTFASYWLQRRTP